MKKREYEELKSKVKELQEQLDNAVIEDDNPFDVKYGEQAYYSDAGYRTYSYNGWHEDDIQKYIPCKDNSIVETRQRRHKLNDLLERFAYENDAVVTEEMWKDEGIKKWCVCYSYRRNGYDIYCSCSTQKLSEIYFTSLKATEQAITEIVEPFMRGEI